MTTQRRAALLVGVGGGRMSPEAFISEEEFSRLYGHGWRKRSVPVSVSQAFRAAEFIHEQQGSRPDPVSLAYDALALAILAPNNWRKAHRGMASRQ